MTLNGALKNRRIWLAALAVALIFSARAAGLGAYLTLENLRAHREVLTGFVASHFIAASLAYAALYVAAVTFSLPGVFFLTLAGGFLFGAIWGTLVTVLGATLGATFFFLFARMIFGDNALERLGPRASLLAQTIKKDAWSYLLALRLAPIFPFFIVNIVAAFAGVSLPTYVWTTAFGITPAALVFSSAGAGLGSVLDKPGPLTFSCLWTPEIMAAFAGLAILSLLAIPLRRKVCSISAS